jgi:hypothetical protein
MFSCVSESRPQSDIEIRAIESHHNAVRMIAFVAFYLDTDAEAVDAKVEICTRGASDAHSVDSALAVVTVVERRALLFFIVEFLLFLWPSVRLSEEKTMRLTSSKATPFCGVWRKLRRTYRALLSLFSVFLSSSSS